MHLVEIDLSEPSRGEVQILLIRIVDAHRILTRGGCG